MKRIQPLSLVHSLVLAVAWLASAQAQTNLPAWLVQPLSLAECIDLALQNNSTILKGKSDLEAAYGLSVQTRAIAIPKVQATGSYQKSDPDGVETFPEVPANIISPFPSLRGDQRWAADVRLVQSIYEGGRITSALRSARLTREQALLQYQTVIADTLLEVRVAYNDVLLAQQQITVQQASIALLAKELEDQKRRFEAGTVPRFNVLRAEVELANARPRLIRAKNSYRIAKNNLANLLGYNLPKEVWEDIPLQLSDHLEEISFFIELPVALAKALESRPELAALRKSVGLTQEAVVVAQALWKPSVQVFTGYGSRNSIFSDDLTRDVSGWFAGAQLRWDIFDGLYTKGRIQEAKARHRRAELDLEDNTRRVELEVRTAYSNFIEAREVLESQKKVQEQAEEALRLATVRSEAGTGTQLDVLNAQTALTQARTTQIEALHDYAVTRARLARAIGGEQVQPK
ncbi:MAG: TolC family protein [Verrucomicrobiota bacterium]